MKLQYLGDARDSFKWHYHDHLAKGIDARHLDIIPMLLPNDDTGQGNIHARTYHSTPEIQSFCEHLRENQNLDSLRKLPEFTGSKYRIRLHKPYQYYNFINSREYFGDIDAGNLTFIDPCTGFEPLHGNDTHLSFADLSYLLDTSPKCAVISVYQHKQRRPFTDTYNDIRQYMRRNHQHSKITAIHNPHVMMVQITICADKVEKVREINRSYSDDNENISIFR